MEHDWRMWQARIDADFGPTGFPPPRPTVHPPHPLHRRPRPLNRPTPDQPVQLLYIECSR